jgi:hypothetical protein
VVVGCTIEELNMALDARKWIGIGVAGILVAGLVFGARGTVEAQAKADGDPAVERARQQIKMLDDIYKTAVVAITDEYVKSESDTPAITVAMGLFDAMKKKGWHEVRLIDATGKPNDEDNIAKDDFEKAAVKAMVNGKSYYEQLVKENGVQRLRAATPVPVVMKKCTMCHSNYKTVKDGVAIGILSYDVPVK